MKLRHLAILAGLVAGLAPSTAAAQAAPKTYGTTHTSYQRIGVTEFVPLDSTMSYSDFLFHENTFSRYPTNGNAYGAFAATVHLPSGALVTDVEFDWCDFNADSNILLLVLNTDYTGHITQFNATSASNGAAGCAYTIATLAPPVQIDNNEGQLIVEVQIPASDGSMSVSGAIVGYQLQVSPAPATATFPDVPTDDPGFQYVEALVASGVTGGCGGGLYCPNSPVTRRQMAIFLAKALGLQFP